MDARRQEDRVSLGNSDLVEDVFGLNLRGLRTIWDMFRRPSTVYTAARDRAWSSRYTPSVRLVFSLLAFTSVLQFIWAGEGSSFHNQVVNQVLASERAGTSEGAVEAADNILDVFVGVFPFFVLACHGILASFLNVWGQGAGLVLRIRLYFLTIVPNGTISALSIFLGLLIEDFQTSAGIFLLMLGGLLDLVTAYRGGVSGNTVRDKVWRAGLMAVCSMIAYFTASNLAFLAALTATS